MYKNYPTKNIIVKIFTKVNSKYLYYVKIIRQYRSIFWVNYMNYIKRIRDLREDNDKTQQQIADYLGTSQTMYARYERGANEIPVRHIIALSKYYNVSTDYLLGLTNQKNHR